MVWSREREAERPPLSVILPRLYLGAERDVTQDQLASLGISYVLSVSRCSPQPSFLPCSRYLRIPIDDSLWDDLLPWIPQALHFIDAAMSSGASVLVHCAAGISRSPALAVAYIMYSLGMDLDQAYRFVKERRPSISPNFNFLGQLQHFQGTLSQKASSRALLLQQLDNRLLSTSGSCRNTDQEMNCHTDVKQEHTETVSHTDRAHELSHSEGNQQPFLSEELRTLPVSLSQKQQVHTSQEAPAPGVHEPVRPAPKPTHLQLPSRSASLVDKRKSLTLSLTPLGIKPSLPSKSSQDATGTTVTKSVPSRETGGPGSHRQVGPPHRDQSPSRSRCRLAEVQEQSLLSPFSFTLNKLLGWGERLLLGGVFVQPVRMGQPALPYRC